MISSKTFINGCHSLDHISVSFVGGDHEAGVVELVSDVDVGSVADQKLDDVQSAFEAGGSQRSGFRLRGPVHVGARGHESFHDFEVTL